MNRRTRIRYFGLVVSLVLGMVVLADGVDARADASPNIPADATVAAPGDATVVLPADLPVKVSADEAAPHKVPFEELPDEVKERIREAIKRHAAEQSKSSESEDEEQEESDKDGKKDDKEESKADADKKKTPEPALSDEVKKLKVEMQEMDAEFQYKVAKYKKEIEEQRLNIEKMKLDNQIAEQLNDQKNNKLKNELERLKVEAEVGATEVKIIKADLEKELAKYQAEKTAAEAKLATENAKRQLDDVVFTEEEYPDEPFKNGVLYISDRRIELNGPIFYGAAKYVCDRIHFFNNQSHKPIFIVIDSSPGGSVLEGMQILQAMKNSEAKIHVVVKQEAASMAAVITTLADHSYVYPNAIVLHHQASTVTHGNTTEHKEQLERFREISSRVIGAVAEKVGLSEEQFIKQMYEARSTGDWDLFGDQAVQHGWAEHVVTEIRETNIRNRPKTSRTYVHLFAGLHEAPADESTDCYEVRLTELVDEKGERYVPLPRLSPLDAWFMYNPDGYYR